MSHTDILNETVKMPNLHFKTCCFYQPIFGGCLKGAEDVKEQENNYKSFFRTAEKTGFFNFSHTKKEEDEGMQIGICIQLVL